jgi:hypothetical protein
VPSNWPGITPNCVTGKKLQITQQLLGSGSFYSAVFELTRQCFGLLGSGSAHSAYSTVVHLYCTAVVIFFGNGSAYSAAVQLFRQWLILSDIGSARSEVVPLNRQWITFDIWQLVNLFSGGLDYSAVDHLIRQWFGLFSSDLSYWAM